MHRMVCTVNQVAWIRWVRGVNWVGGLIFNKVYQLHRRCQLSTDVWYLSDRLFVYSSIPYSSIRPFFYLSVCPHAPGLLLPPVSCDLTKHPQVQGRADPMLLPASDSAPRSRCGPGTLPPPPGCASVTTFCYLPCRFPPMPLSSCPSGDVGWQDSNPVLQHQPQGVGMGAALLRPHTLKAR